MANRGLGTLTVSLVAEIGGFVRGMDKAERQSKKRLNEIKKNAEAAGKAIGLAFTAAATALAAGVRAAINNADAIDEMAQRTGIAAETLSRLQVAAKFGAVSMEDLQKSVGRLAVEQQKYAEGNEDTVALFDALGVKAVDASGKLRSAESVLIDLAEVFQEIPDGAQKTALAIDLFGKAGQNLIPFLNQGGEKIAELNDQADRLGITLSAETARAAGDFNDQLDLVTFAVQGLAAQVAAELLPDLNSLVQSFNEGATSGDGFKSTAEQIAEAIRGIASAAGVAFDTIETMTLGIVGLTASAASLAATYTPILRSLTTSEQRQALDDLAAVSLAGAGEARDRVMNGPGQTVAPIEWIDPPAPKESGRGPALDDLYAKRKRDAEAAKGQAAADRAAAEAARELERADAELARRLEEMARLQEDFTAGLDALEAQLSGPLAEAELDHSNRLKEVQTLLDQGVITVEEATRAQMLYAEAFEKTRDQIDPYGEGLRLLLEDMDFELDLLGKTNAERVTELELRRLGIELGSEEAAAAAARIRSRVEEYEAMQEQISAMDDFRSSFEDNVAGVLDGSKSISDALKDMVNDFIAQLARLAAQRFTEQLFGQMGSGNTGAAGGWLSGLFSAFGRARASGGPVSAGVPYLVGEEGPELIVPNAAGTVIPADRTAAMRGGGRGATNITFVLPGRNDLRTEAQRQSDLARSTNRQLARGTA